jgi:hypothetical protein
MKQINSVARPFGGVLRDLLLDKEVTTPMGNPDWAGFAQQLPGIHYETLRKAVTGERPPAPKVIEAVSDALSVSPETFVEYKLWVARRTLDPHEVGLDEAVRNLTRLDCPAEASS